MTECFAYKDQVENNESRPAPNDQKLLGEKVKHDIDTRLRWNGERSAQLEKFVSPFALF